MAMVAEAEKGYLLLQPLSGSPAGFTSGSTTVPPSNKSSRQQDLRGELNKLTTNRDKVLADRQQVDSELKQVQDQVKELQTSITVKENLLDDLISTDKQMKATNRQMVKKIQLLYEESAKTRRDLREAQQCLKVLHSS